MNEYRKLRFIDFEFVKVLDYAMWELIFLLFQEVKMYFDEIYVHVAEKVANGLGLS